MNPRGSSDAVEENMSYFLPGIEPRLFGCPFHNLVGLLSGLSQVSIRFQVWSWDSLLGSVTENNDWISNSRSEVTGEVSNSSHVRTNAEISNNCQMSKSVILLTMML